MDDRQLTVSFTVESVGISDGSVCMAYVHYLPTVDEKGVCNMGAANVRWRSEGRSAWYIGAFAPPAYWESR